LGIDVNVVERVETGFEKLRRSPPCGGLGIDVNMVERVETGFEKLRRSPPRGGGRHRYGREVLSTSSRIY
jgi:hypothetical protein